MTQHKHWWAAQTTSVVGGPAALTFEASDNTWASQLTPNIEAHKALSQRYPEDDRGTECSLITAIRVSAAGNIKHQNTAEVVPTPVLGPESRNELVYAGKMLTQQVLCPALQSLPSNQRHRTNSTKEDQTEWPLECNYFLLTVNNSTIVFYGLKTD